MRDLKPARGERPRADVESNEPAAERRAPVPVLAVASCVAAGAVVLLLSLLF